MRRYLHRPFFYNLIIVKKNIFSWPSTNKKCLFFLVQFPLILFQFKQNTIKAKFA